MTPTRTTAALSLSLSLLWALLGCAGGSGGTADGAGDGGGGAETGADARGGNDSGSPDGGAQGDGGTTGNDGSAGDATPQGDGGAPNASKQCPAVSPGDHEMYSLPPPANLPAGVASETDWAADPTSGGWNGEQIMDQCRMHPDGFTTWHGKTAVRAEVQPKDDPLALGENTERAEMLTMQDANGKGFNWDATSGDLYIATSYYFPASWTATFYPYSVFETPGNQWPNGQTNDCSGAGNLCNSWSFVMQLYGWGALSAASRSVGGPQTLALSLANTDIPLGGGAAIALAKWTDLVIEANFTSGAVNVWRRDEGQSAFMQVGNATVPPPSGSVYLKQGLYRGGNVNGRTDVFWIGPTAIGATFSAVEQAAFATNVGP